MCAATCVCMWVHEGPQRLPAHRSVYVSLYWFVINDRGDGLLSFNYKLAVLVSEADVQIKKVRHARLILVNLPLHISPACQLLCDSNHHRHMPLLCVPPPPPPPKPLLHSSCSLLSRT